MTSTILMICSVLGFLFFNAKAFILSQKHDNILEKKHPDKYDDYCIGVFSSYKTRKYYAAIFNDIFKKHIDDMELEQIRKKVRHSYNLAFACLFIVSLFATLAMLIEGYHKNYR